LVIDMIELIRQYGRYGYRCIAALVRDALWQVNDNRIERLRRREGQKYPANNPTRVPCGEMTDHVSACGQLTVSISGPMTLCITGQMTAGLLRTLNIINDLTREYLAIRVGRYVRGPEVIETLSDAMLSHGIPEHTRSDNDPEMTPKRVKNWLQQIGVQTFFIEPGNPRENGYNEPFNGALSDECLNGEIFYSLEEAQIHRTVANTLST
jgi:putative transposase